MQMDANVTMFIIFPSKEATANSGM